MNLPDIKSIFLSFKVTAFTFAVALSTLVSQQPQAATHVLEKNKILVKEYNSLQIEEGDTLVFEKVRIKLGKFLGSGRTTLVFELKDEPHLAIRIPKKDYFASFIDETLEGEPLLTQKGIPHVRILRSQPRRYVIVSRLPDDAIPLRDAIKEALVAPEKRAPLEKAIADFAHVTAEFTQIGDFRMDQLAWVPTSQKWVLFDWRDQHRLISNTNQDHLINRAFFNYFFARIPDRTPEYQWISHLKTIAHHATRSARERSLQLQDPTQTCVSHLSKSNE